MKRDIKIKLAGKNYRVRLTVGAMIDIEDELGRPLMSMVNADISFKLASVVFKNGIRNEDGSRVFDDEAWNALMYVTDPTDMFSALNDVIKEVSGDEDTEEGETGKNE